MKSTIAAIGIVFIPLIGAATTDGITSTSAGWAIITALAGTVAFLGKWILTRQADCERDRKQLNRKVNKLATAMAAKLGEPIDLEDDSENGS